MVGSGEVALHREALFQQLVAMELCSVIEGDRGKGSSVFLEDRKSCLCNGGRRTRFQFLDYCQPGLAFYQGQQPMVKVATHDGITFPVPELGT